VRSAGQKTAQLVAISMEARRKVYRRHTQSVCATCEIALDSHIGPVQLVLRQADTRRFDRCIA